MKRGGNMQFLIIWESAVKSVKKNARRSFLTMLGLIIGVAAVITIVSVGRGYEKYQRQKMLGNSDSELTELGYKFEPEDSEFETTGFEHFSDSDFELIRGVEGVKEVAYVEEPKNDTKRTKKYRFRDKEYSGNVQLIYSTQTAKRIASNSGRSLEEADLINRNKVALVASTLITDVKAEELLNQIVTIDGEDFLIVGVFEANEFARTKIQIPASTHNTYWPDDKNHEIKVKFSSQYTTTDMAETLYKLLEEKGSMAHLGGYTLVGDAIMADTMGEMFGSMTAIFTLVGAISLFISGVGVMNMIYTSVSERMKEIGIRRALGATEGTIQMQFLLEGLTITLMGGVIGYFCGLLIAKFISLVMSFDFVPDMFTAFVAVGISILIGVGFSYYPSKSATEKDVVELVK